MHRIQSNAVYEKACKVIPGGVNSPVRSFLHLNMPPLIVESGKGGKIVDVDGNAYIDFCGSWGALILGHADDAILDAVYQQMQKGTSFGIATTIELLIAEEIVKLLPSVEKIRFVNSGTEATMTAMRIARGATRRPKILKFSGHYHGHSDALLIQAGSGVARLSLSTSKGVNPSTIADTLCLPFNDFEALHTFFRSPESASLAAVILEPVAGNMGVVPPEPGFLELLREKTRQNGSLLIFDEVITGFRVSLQGAQGQYGIDPDLTCLGKIIGGGFPVAAVGGKAQFLDLLAPLGQVYQAGTLSGNPVAMRAGVETLKRIQQPGFYASLQAKTDRMVFVLREALQGKQGCVQQCGSMFSLFFGLTKVRSKEDLKHLNEELFIKFFQYLFERGIYISPSSHEACFITSAHLDSEIDHALECMTQFIQKYV